MKKRLWIITALIVCLAALSAAGFAEAKLETTPAGYLCFLDDDPTTMDPQCTSEYYTIPLNVFDRLVEVQTDGGESSLKPSLAESWDITPDGLTYTFHLRPNVVFSNGSPLTSEDVKFTFERLLTHPRSENQDLVISVAGAEALRAGEASELAGFRIIDETTFEVTLSHPYAPFLACLSTPGASILDGETTREAGDTFGQSIEKTVGTGAFMLEKRIDGAEILLSANPNYWDGPVGCEGLRMLFLENTVSVQQLFENGTLDILDLEYLEHEAEYFIHGDIYQPQLHQGSRVGITYLALNERIEPLDDVRVRKALQMALDRKMLMKAIIGGRGNVENGIFPHGLMGWNPDLPEIPCDPEEAARLLAEAGYPEGFELEIYRTNASDSDLDQIQVIAYMLEKVGVRLKTVSVSSDEFMTLRRSGQIPSYISTWSADFNDPDNFIYTFFGTVANTASRSLNYGNLEVIRRVTDARAIVDTGKRTAEYHELERKIVQEDAAWIPLYSRQHFFVVSPRVSGFQVSWNGWSSTNYRGVSILK